MHDHRSYFVRVGERRFIPQPPCGGAWNPDELHISPVNGLLTHAMCQWLDARPDDGLQAARISLDYYGVLDFTECEVEFAVLRPGRAVQLVEGVLSQHGRPVLHARAWRIATSDTTDIAGGASDPMPPPDSADVFDAAALWPGGFIRSIEIRAVQRPRPGRSTAWITTSLPIVEGEPSTDLARFVLLVDTANGIAARESPERWQFPNLDLTIHLFRQPSGGWVGFDTEVTFGPHGHGLTSSALFDARGHVGRAEQALIVRRQRREVT